MITCYGYLGDASQALRTAAEEADYVVGGRRHLDALGVEKSRRIVLGALTPAVEKISTLPDDVDVVIVASGDPLWFGVVRKLRSYGLRPKVVPAASSVAEAFARVGLPWDDSVTVSAHGRPIDQAVQAARRYTKVAVMTDPREPMSVLTEPLADLDRVFVLAERLGESDERVRILDGATLGALDDVVHPSVVLVLAKHPDDDWDDDAIVTTAGPRTTLPVADASQPVRERMRSGSKLRIGQVASSSHARARVKRIDDILGVESLIYDGSAREGLVRAFDECDLVISHLALGATIRLIAPLLTDKKHDPGVVVIDQGGRFVVPLVGGHVGGANELATRLAEGLDATAVVTTATDSLGINALDTLGWYHYGDVAQVTGAILDGQPVAIRRSQPWPIPPLPDNVSEDAAEACAHILVSDEVIGQFDIPTVVLRPPSLVVGMGCNSGTDVSELESLLRDTCAEAGLATESIVAITSVDAKEQELGLHRIAAKLDVPFLTYPASTLAAHSAPNPSALVAQEVGTPSVAEASVMEYGAELVVDKRKNAEATCAIGRIPARGKLSVVGLGPGSRDLLTPMAKHAIQQANYVVGYGPYVRQIRDLAGVGATIHATKMGTEAERIAYAIERAREGSAVAFVCSGDPAIYAMASPTLEMGTDGIDVEIVPGVTAELAASALLGAPLGHDHVTISLSDLHTSWDDIERRLEAASEGDFVTVLYNPRSKKRRMHLPRALEILGRNRPADTPVAAVRNAFRPRQLVTWAPLSEFDPESVTMNTIVIVGSSSTTTVGTGSGERVIVTPREYRWMPER